jgi:hypothetical protein
LIAVGQLFVRERSNDAAIRFFIAGGLVLVGPAAHFLPLGPLMMVHPLLIAGAAGCAVWGLFLLADELHPKAQGQRLPPGVEALRASGPGSGLGPRIVYAVFAVLAIVAYGRFMDSGAIAASVLAVAGVILGGHFLNQRGSWAVWVLDRHPEWVVWVYPSQLTVINRRYGTRTVYWRAIIGLSNGLELVLPAGSDLGAGQLAAEVASVCPGAAVGHSQELAARFRADPASLRKA